MGAVYKIEFEKAALKFLKKQPKPQQIRILKAIEKLPDGDVKKIQGLNEWYRLRVGDYRIIYTIENDILLITVVNIGNRGQNYKNL
jgi:mRNA interferase RelE/StbE